VARADADTTAFYALMDEAVGECELEIASTCDCPEAYGFACVDRVCEWGYPSRTDPYPDCRAEAGDPYEVGGIVVDGDTLVVTVSYSGGCEEHTFTPCFDGAFAESDPVQATLELFHDDHGDTCEAYPTVDVPVDLAPLKAYWQASYGTSSGTITIHLDGQTATYTF
jgi:hypothetical protein